ncbi:MAG: DUF2997 domain-containing protein [Elusimicrobia bacterium]|nr:DUF2997 domain-containing protein [Elusimicrobiota bacterium]
MELDITIAPDGTLHLDIKGVKGKACLETAELFKKIVGPEAKKKLTSEYYEPGAHITRDVRRR